jgi:hypothetical protein
MPTVLLFTAEEDLHQFEQDETIAVEMLEELVRNIGSQGLQDFRVMKSSGRRRIVRFIFLISST